MSRDVHPFKEGVLLDELGGSQGAPKFKSQTWQELKCPHFTAGLSMTQGLAAS